MREGELEKEEEMEGCLKSIAHLNRKRLISLGLLKASAILIMTLTECHKLRLPQREARQLNSVQDEDWLFHFPD